MSYWDSSALAKLFLIEADSDVFRKRAMTDFPLITAQLARYELLTTFRRREAEGMLQTGAAKLLLERFDRFVSKGRIILQADTPFLSTGFEKVLDDCFSASPPVFVRTNDAIHVAAAGAAGERDFVTADVRQKKAAETCGLTV